MSIFVNQEKKFFPIQFSLPKRNHFGGSGEKTLGPHYLFSFLPTQSNTFQKKISSYFLSKVFHPPYFTFKQTHPKGETIEGSSVQCVAHVGSSPHLME